MQLFSRELAHTHCVGALWPEFCGQVALGEAFVIETEEVQTNGPIEIAGVRVGEAIAVHIERIEIEGPFRAPNGGPFLEGLGPPVPLTYRQGWFSWPGHFRLEACPSVGNVAVLPEPTDEVLGACRTLLSGPHKGEPNSRGWRTVVRDPRGKHCHQDCWAARPGSIVHLRAQVDGAGLCLDDVHAYIGQGELAFAGIEVRARVQVRVERSVGWWVDWPLIETDDEIMVICSFAALIPGHPAMKYVDLVREAYRALREVVAKRVGGTIAEANSIVATAADLRNCALYGLGEGYIPQHRDRPPHDMAVAACLPKQVFP
ncbi:MAG: acetamidase/formamidase family protein [Anaerolineae bacterium]|nr:acetamidase/formamidase family protein [Anaerolineae bacterium]